MREIKFRQRLDGRFHYWGMINGEFIGPASSSLGGNPATTPHDQYTGRLDKNGVEIYEGDIVAYINMWNGKRASKGVVRFEDGSFENCREFTDPWAGDMPVEVIGNIYENPELCKLAAEGGPR